MLRPVKAMNGQIVQPLTMQPLENSVQLTLSLLKGNTWQELAGDHPIPSRTMLAALKGSAQKVFRRSVSRCRFQVIDACLDSGVEHLGHLIG